MKIVFFGSSHGIPEPNRKCSSTLIEVGERRYFIDMGTQSIEGVIGRGIPVESVEAIFITHMHGDHTNGLLSFIDECSWKFKKADPIVYLPKDPEAVREALEGWIRCNGVPPRSFDYRLVTEGEIYDDGFIRVTAFRTKHIDFSYAYLIEAEGKRVFFSGDLSHKGPSDDFPTSVLDTPLELAICEAAHFDATDYLPIFEGNKNLKRLCFNHYSERRLSSVLAMPALLSDIEVIRAADGLEITV